MEKIEFNIIDREHICYDRVDTGENLVITTDANGTYIYIYIYICIYIYIYVCVCVCMCVCVCV